MDDQIFIPLGMTRTFFQDDHEEVVAGRVTSYAPQAGKFQRIGNGLMASGSSSLHTTTEDLLKWVQNFETPIVGTPAVHSMMNLQGTLGDGTDIPYGFGLIQGTYRGLKTFSHSGGWAGFRTTILRIPDHKFAVILLGNHASLNAPALAQRVAEHYLEAYMTPPEMPPVPLRLGEQVNDYEGVYDFSEAHVLRLTTNGSSLFAHLPPAPSVPAQSIGADSIYIPALRFTLSFSRDSLGQITHASTTEHEAKKSPLPEVMDLTPLEGCYNSEELDISYQMLIEDGALVAEGPRGRKFQLTQALENVFTSDSWLMPVIRFFSDQDAPPIIYFEVNSPRNRNVVFTKKC